MKISTGEAGNARRNLSRVAGAMAFGAGGPVESACGKAGLRSEPQKILLMAFARAAWPRRRSSRCCATSSTLAWC